MSSVGAAPLVTIQRLRTSVPWQDDEGGVWQIELRVTPAGAVSVWMTQTTAEHHLATRLADAQAAPEAIRMRRNRDLIGSGLVARLLDAAEEESE